MQTMETYKAHVPFVLINAASKPIRVTVRGTFSSETPFCEIDDALLDMAYEDFAKLLPAATDADFYEIDIANYSGPIAI